MRKNSKPSDDRRDLRQGVLNIAPRKLVVAAVLAQQEVRCIPYLLRADLFGTEDDDYALPIPVGHNISQPSNTHDILFRINALSKDNGRRTKEWIIPIVAQFSRRNPILLIKNIIIDPYIRWIIQRTLLDGIIDRPCSRRLPYRLWRIPTSTPNFRIHASCDGLCATLGLVDIGSKSKRVVSTISPARDTWRLFEDCRGALLAEEPDGGVILRQGQVIALQEVGHVCVRDLGFDGTRCEEQGPEG